jgi:hypothetical protein
MATGTMAQTSSAQEAGRPQPQTTVESGGGPFIRHSQPGRAPLYTVSGTLFGGIVTQPLVARPGYFRNLRVTHAITGATGAPTLFTDQPYNLTSLVQLKDAFGTPLIVAPGWYVNLVNLFGGAFGLPSANVTNVASNLPSWVAISATGNGTFSYSLPLEFAKAYGVLSAANASLLPTLQFNFNSIAGFYNAAPTGSPVIQTVCDTDFYWLPEGVAVEPPGLGTTRQWILQQANPTIPSAGAARIQFPRLGGYLDTIVMDIRNSSSPVVRDGGFWPVRFQLYVDGVPMIDTLMTDLYNDMAIQFGLTGTQVGYTAGAVTAAAQGNFVGDVAISRKTSLNQTNLGLLDTGETFLSTNPGTLLEANFAPAGTATGTGPGTMNVLVGQIVPTGAIIQGLPEV